MARNITFWCFLALFVVIQFIMICSMIYRENRYVGRLYQLQKLEQFQTQLTNEYNALQHELQKSKNLLSLKEYAEQQLHLQKLPLSAFRALYDNNEL